MEQQMDQYMALSKKDLQINITLNELYNTQSLLLQHLDSLVRISSHNAFATKAYNACMTCRHGMTSNTFVSFSMN
jgi:hypothetical protein